MTTYYAESDLGIVSFETDPLTRRDIPRIFHAGCAASLNVGSDLHKHWCAILGLNQ
jgi:tRNA U34 5-methylaminomethyl-2-thiouridine-forming methyltransferase MnmC